MTDKQTQQVSTPAKEGSIQRPMPSRVLSPFEEMERMIEAFVPRGWLRRGRWEWPEWSDLPTPFEGRTPKVDVIERDEDILVKAELPGIDKNDIDISVTDNTLSIKASEKREAEKEEGEFYRKEIVEGAFSRSILLPAEVDGDKAKATFKDGLLEVYIPKIRKAKRRKIEVS